MLGDDYDISDLKNFSEDPIKVLTFHNKMESKLAEISQSYKGCKVGLRSLKLAYNRMDFNEVRKALYDISANPFIEFYNQLINQEIIPENPRIVGISVTFQDQIIAGFTLARLVREKLPEAKIVMGGQMITRCYDTLYDSKVLKDFWDYLVLWEGEVPLLDIHEAVINDRKVEFINVLENGKHLRNVDRSQKALPTKQQSAPDFSHIDFDKYFFSDMLIPLQTSRSCYAKCEFCAIPYGANLRFRTKSCEQVLNHILKIRAHIKKRYNRDAVYFKFMDDSSSPKVLWDLSKRIESLNINVRWEAFARLDKIYANDEFTTHLYRGGSRKLCWGLESCDPDILGRMKKQYTESQSTCILNASAKAGILNFCFILVGFPGETQEQRDSMVEYIINNPDIHVLTIATFDFTKFSPMHQKYKYPNKHGIYCEKAKGFEVRLPYMIDGHENWKKMVVGKAHEMLLQIIEARPDIGLMSLFIDQIRQVYCEKYGNNWGHRFLKKYGAENIRALMGQTEEYLKAFEKGKEINMSALPEPLQREYHREVEDLIAIQQATSRRRQYEERRIDQV
jgi:radical SAM superfamily enzyme YgiQ (UPF0313 family)